MLISCAVTAQLICVFLFAYAKSQFSHDEAKIVTKGIIMNITIKSIITTSKSMAQEKYAYTGGAT